MIHMSSSGAATLDSNDKTCATCKHRGDDPIKSWRHDEVGKSVVYYECRRIEHDKRWEYEPGQGAVVTDGSGYRAALCVELTFGCNKWEAK